MLEGSCLRFVNLGVGRSLQQSHRVQAVRLVVVRLPVSDDFVIVGLEAPAPLGAGLVDLVVACRSCHEKYLS